MIWRTSWTTAPAGFVEEEVLVDAEPVEPFDVLEPVPGAEAVLVSDVPEAVIGAEAVLVFDGLETGGGVEVLVGLEGPETVEGSEVVVGFDGLETGGGVEVLVGLEGPETVGGPEVVVGFDELEPPLETLPPPDTVEPPLAGAELVDVPVVDPVFVEAPWPPRLFEGVVIAVFAEGVVGIPHPLKIRMPGKLSASRFCLIFIAAFLTSGIGSFL